MASTLITAPQARNLTRNQIFVTFESDQFTGTPGAYVPSVVNLSCKLEIWAVIGGVDTYIDTVYSPYSTIDKRTTFEISGFFPSVYAPPSDASIGEFVTPLYAEAEGIVTEFFLKYADQYGSPVAADTLEESAHYLAIHGGLPADAVQDPNWLGNGVGLHSYYYRRSSSYTFLKPVTPEQPDWIYFVSLVTGDIVVTVTIQYSDNTVDFFNSFTMECEEDTAYWLQSGYLQLHVDDNADPLKTVVGYNVSLIYSDENFFTVFHTLDQICSPWEQYILMYNGIGGYESVRFRGPVDHADRVSRETINRTRWSTFDIREGDIDDFHTEGTPVTSINSGHYPWWYLNHLRQIIRGRLWLIDVDEVRLKRIRCETNQLPLYSEANPPHSIDITYSNAWLDDGFNVY